MNNLEDTEIDEKIGIPDDLSSIPVAQKEKENSPSNVLQFRDGEHSGEAPLEEITEGYDDGELSDKCLIYDQTTDSWITITSYINVHNSIAEEDEDEPVENDDLNDQEENASEVIIQHNPIFEIEPSDDFQPISKNDRKKPKRDVSAWGKGQVQTLTTKTEVNKTSTSRRKNSKHIKPPAKLMRLCTQAMIQWDMLEDGDRLLLGLSGGKDSMSLLHVLLEFQKKLPVKFEIEVSKQSYCTLYPESAKGFSQHLIPYNLLLVSQVCTIDPMTPSFGTLLKSLYIQSLYKWCLPGISLTLISFTFTLSL